MLRLKIEHFSFFFFQKFPTMRCFVFHSVVFTSKCDSKSIICCLLAGIAKWALPSSWQWQWVDLLHDLYILNLLAQSESQHKPRKLNLNPKQCLSNNQIWLPTSASLLYDSAIKTGSLNLRKDKNCCRTVVFNLLYVQVGGTVCAAIIFLPLVTCCSISPCIPIYSFIFLEQSSSS